MPERQVPWVIGILFALVFAAIMAFVNYTQDRIQNGYLLLNAQSERIARLEEREKTDAIVRLSLDTRISSLERGKSSPK